MTDEIINLHGQPLQIKISRGPGGRYDFEVSLFGIDPNQTIDSVNAIIERLNSDYPFTDKK